MTNLNKPRVGSFMGAAASEAAVFGLTSNKSRKEAVAGAGGEVGGPAIDATDWGGARGAAVPGIMGSKVWQKKAAASESVAAKRRH